MNDQRRTIDSDLEEDPEEQMLEQAERAPVWATIVAAFDLVRNRRRG